MITLILTHSLTVEWTRGKTHTQGHCSCGVVSEAIRPETGVALDLFVNWHQQHLTSIAA